MIVLIYISTWPRVLLNPIYYHGDSNEYEQSHIGADYSTTNT